MKKDLLLSVSRPRYTKFSDTTMTLQYARIFQLRAGLNILHNEGPLKKEPLVDSLVRRKSVNADLPDSEEGAEDIITELKNTWLVISDGEILKLSRDTDLPKGKESLFLYSGKSTATAGGSDVQAHRILTNVISAYPELILLTKHIYRHGPMKDYELKREFDGKQFQGNKMNSFTIDICLHLLNDAGAIESTDRGYLSGRWPEQVFAYVTGEEYRGLVDGSKEMNVKQSRLFERIETLYGIDRDTFERLLSRLQRRGIVTEGSYEELNIDIATLREAGIYE